MTKKTTSKGQTKKANKAKQAEAAEDEEEDEESAGTCEIDREKARGLLEQIGLKNAAKADDAKILGRLKLLDGEDDTLDVGKFKKTYNKIVEANAAGAEIVLTGGDEEEEEAPKKGAKKAEGKAAPKKGGKKSGPGVGRGPGVIGEIAELLKKAKKNSPITKEEIVKHLAKKFPERSAESMKKTVAVQVPTRISAEKGLNVKKGDKGYYT
jgi:hypothetical protein